MAKHGVRKFQFARRGDPLGTVIRSRGTAESNRAKWIRVMALRFKVMPRLMTLIGFRGREKRENAKGKIL